MNIDRLFTIAGHDPYEDVDFAGRASRIVNPDGSTVFEAANITMPSDWSQVASDIMAQKYFRKTGVPTASRRVPEEDVPDWLWRSEPENATTPSTGETDARQTFNRLVGTWTYWGWKHGYFDTEDDALAFHDELAHMLATQRAAPNSPQWFNTGMHWAYGISGPAQGHLYVDPVTGVLTESGSAYERPQPHACFIQSVTDDLVGDGGIMDLWTREARLFKYGSGTGSNFSTIRAEGEPLSGGGKSSGLMSFLKIGDRAAGAIKSGGTTRRAAKMVIVDMDHPDVESFIDWKSDEEHKVASLVAGSRLIRKRLRKVVETTIDGLDPTTNRPLRRAIWHARRDGVPEAYVQRALLLVGQGVESVELIEFDTDWQGEAYQTVAGQNANNSVRVTADFLDAVREDRPWHLTRRTDGSVMKTVQARDLWNRIAQAAWSSADPGIQYDTTINEWHTSPAGGRIRGSNPCSEYMFLDDTACNLASLNLVRFYDLDSRTFDIAAYEHATRLWTVVLEISVLMAQYPSPQIAQLSHDYRTLGLGYANLGTLLMLQGIPYDSPDALAQTGAYSALLTGVSYATSAEMSSELGAFPEFPANRDTMLHVMRNHRRAAYNVPADEYEGLTALPRGLDSDRCPAPIAQAARESWDRALELGERHGYRNAQTTLIAPTGTIGLLMDCDTTGVEPDFALVKFKKLAGGGYFRIINESVPDALRALGYTEEAVHDITVYCAGTGSLEGTPHINRDSLTMLGFTPDVLDTIESALGSAFDISFALNPWTIGEEFCRETLGFTAEQLADPNFSLLSALGFTREQVEVANDVVTGRMTIEGAPHLRAEHYPVFDCANRCGRYGTRFIEPLAHVRTMSAAQPFISGAISKTINMPEDATVEDVTSVYNAGETMMLKAVALYRDGSKLSQPLSSALFDDEDADYDDEDEIVPSGPAGPDGLGAISEAERILNALPTMDARDAVRRSVGLLRGERVPIPARARGFRQKARVGGFTIYMHTGEYDDGSLGEVFVSMSKDGAAFRSLMNCFAIAVSIGLQHGVPLDAYVDSFVHTKFEPNGMVTGNDRIKMSSSIIDYVFRELAISYLGRTELGHLTDDIEDPETQVEMFGPEIMSVGEPDIEDAPMPPAGGVQASLFGGVNTAVAEPAAGGGVTTQMVAQARQLGLEGTPCDTCGQMSMVRNGSCLKCMSCGSTTGCS